MAKCATNRAPSEPPQLFRRTLWGRDGIGPGRGSRDGNWSLGTVEDVRDYVADHTKAFAGMRVESAVVIVAFTADLGSHRLGSQASVEHPEYVRVELAEQTSAQLEPELNAIFAQLQAHPRSPGRWITVPATPQTGPGPPHALPRE